MLACFVICCLASKLASTYGIAHSRHCKSAVLPCRCASNINQYFEGSANPEWLCETRSGQSPGMQVLFPLSNCHLSVALLLPWLATRKSSLDMQTVCVCPNPFCILLSCQAQTTAAHVCNACIVPHSVQKGTPFCVVRVQAVLQRARFGHWDHSAA